MMEMNSLKNKRPRPVVLALIAAIAVNLYMAVKVGLGILNKHHKRKEDFFSAFEIQPNDVVFLGDSLTEGGNWVEMFPAISVKNRGINGDTIHGVLARLEVILRGEPKAIFLLIGTNDLFLLGHLSDSQIISGYTRILEKIKVESPDTKVYVQSLLPRQRLFARRILGLNNEIQKIAGQFEYVYIDLFPNFATQENTMRPEYTNDDLHLLAEGYQRWCEILRPYVDTLK